MEPVGSRYRPVGTRHDLDARGMARGQREGGLLLGHAITDLKEDPT